MGRLRRHTLYAVLIGALACACSPKLNWREVRPEASGVELLFPCKPTSRTRSAVLAGTAVPMTLVSCEAEGVTYALGHAELSDPALVTTALIQMRSALAANVGAREARAEAFVAAGTTPNPRAVRVWLEGRMPDGSPAQEQAALFVRGTRVYEAVVLGAQLDEAAANVYFENLRAP